MEIINRIDWINVVVGFLIGLLPIAVPFIIDVIKSFLDPRRKKFDGKYYLYHRSGTQPQLIREKIITFKHRINGKTIVSLPNSESVNLSYKGQLFKGSNGLIHILLKGLDSDNMIFMVCFDPITSKLKTTSGMLASVDLLGNPISLRFIINDEQISELEQVKFFEKDSPNKSLRVNMDTPSSLAP